MQASTGQLVQAISVGMDGRNLPKPENIGSHLNFLQSLRSSYLNAMQNKTTKI